MKFDKCDICKEFRDCYCKTSFLEESRFREYFKYPIKHICKECLKNLKRW